MDHGTPSGLSTSQSPKWQNRRRIVLVCTRARYSRCTLPRNVPIACPSVELIDVCSGTLPRTTVRTICILDTLWPTLKSTLSWQLRPSRRFSHVRAERTCYVPLRRRAPRTKKKTRYDMIIKAHQKGYRTGEATCITPEIRYIVYMKNRGLCMKRRGNVVNQLKT